MRIPSWLVIVMLTSCVITLVISGARWWTTWPEATARSPRERLIHQ